MAKCKKSSEQIYHLVNYRTRSNAGIQVRKSAVYSLPYHKKISICLALKEMAISFATVFDIRHETTSINGSYRTVFASIELV